MKMTKKNTTILLSVFAILAIGGIYFIIKSFRKPTGKGRKWKRPVTGIITSPFGNRNNPITGHQQFHNGTDYGAKIGTPVYASDSGTVKRASYDSKNGNMIVIDHGDGAESYYLHLNKKLASQGQKVKRGQKIGTVGTTGLSTGAHLHFIIKLNGKAVDPEKLLS